MTPRPPTNGSTADRTTATTPEAAGHDDPTTASILDAAYASVLAFGVRRTNLSDVARRAGVSRMTVYRRFPDIRTLIRDLMTREFTGLMPGDVRHEGDDRPLSARLAHMSAALRAHPLWRKVVEAEPELLMPYVVDRMGSTQRIAAARLEHDIELGQAEGSIRAGDPALLAQVVMLITQSFVFSASTSERVTEDQLLAELEPLLERVLKP